jgi:CMP-N-acetylneuraminic acid synthetase
MTTTSYLDPAAAIIPIKTNNQRLPGKNTRLLGGKPLLNHLFDTVASCHALAAVFIDSSDESILDIARWYGFQPIKRPEELNSPATSGHDLLEFELPQVDYPIIAQLFVTQPFLTAKTIAAAVELLRTSPEVDSILPVFPIHNRFWHGNQPVAHDPASLRGTQYAKPVYCETGFYVFRRDAFLREKARVTAKRKPLVGDALEGTDIDEEKDFLYAEAVYEWLQKKNQH